MVPWTFSVKHFLKFETYFSYATRRALSNHHEKRKNHSSEIFNSGQTTYSVNTLKTEYLCPGSLRAAHILNSLVSR